ncbi:MAG: nitronate monooxygenase [Actinobacteria bacterium]|nr:nitronate monooxygenase [Actinomycetota bacterium]
MTPSALRTRFCDLVGVEHPIVQTGMGWVSGARLTSATANAGGLGILASATMTFDELDAAIAEVRRRAPGKPFGVNLRADQPDVNERIALLVRQQVTVASFAQAPSRETIARLKDQGVVCIPTIGARRHAEKVAAWGVDAVIAQGAEGGGHTGSVPTSLLLPQVVDTVDIPVIGAGGFHDGRGLVAALAWGADAIAMGTRFLLTSDSTVPDVIKQIYLSKTVNDTVVSTAIDGYPQRVIRTEVVDEIEKASALTRFPKALKNALEFRKLTNTSYRSLVKEGLAMKRNQELTWSQLAMAANAPVLIKASMVDGQPEVGILPTGQGLGVIDDLPSVSELIRRILDEAERSLKRLGATGS